MATSPFHPGEQAIQAALGVRAKIESAGRRMIHDFMPEQHRAFFAQLPYLILGARDLAGRPWASLLVGAPGFAHAPDPRTLRIDARLEPGDPLAGALTPGAEVGLLGIEPPTRRRNRLNGPIAARDATGFSVTARQSFGNCPKYITPRDWQPTPAAGPARTSDHLDRAAKALVRAADTFYIASHAADPSAGGTDVSHRGGPPGFVSVDDAGTLSWPDYSGNFLFNTLGNLVVDARAGLLFVDFATGARLQLTGRAEIVWSGPEVDARPGAERLLRFHIAEVVARP